jgi:hypothetical protein
MAKWYKSDKFGWQHNVGAGLTLSAVQLAQRNVYILHATLLFRWNTLGVHIHSPRTDSPSHQGII